MYNRTLLVLTLMVSSEKAKNNLYSNLLISRPEDFANWNIVNGTEVTKFAAYPIHADLTSIVDLLTDENLGISSTQVRDFFKAKQATFCSDFLGLSPSECDARLIGCGMTGFCEEGSYCAVDFISPKKFQCRKHAPETLL